MAETFFVCVDSYIAAGLSGLPCGHWDLSPDLNGNGEIEPEEWVKACPCFDAEIGWNQG